MRGDILLKILETIGGVGIDFVDLVTALITAGYGASYNQISRIEDRIGTERASRRWREAEEQITRQRIQNFVGNLKKQGLIISEGTKEKRHLIVTPKGIVKLNTLKSRTTRLLPSNKYQKIAGNNFIILVFDVPEKVKYKREWLRFALGNLGFSKLQKSVWLGKVKLPEKFIKDLEDLSLTEYVEILEISKTGSLRQLI